MVRSLCNRTEKAIEQFSPEKVVVAGGVSANSFLRRDMKKLCKKRRVKLYFPELKYCGDNAAMIGSQAFYEYQKGHIADLKLNAAAVLDIDK